MMSPTRNHWSSIITKSFREIFSNLIFLLILIKWIEKYIVPIAIVLGIIIIVVSIVGWKNNIFYIKNNILFVESGVFTKKKIEVPLEKISTVDTERGVIDSLIGVSVLRINTGAIDIGGSSEFKFTLRNEDIDNIKNILLSKSKIDIPKTDNINIEDKAKVYEFKYEISCKDIFKYALTKSKIIMIIPIGYVFDKLDILFDLEQLEKYIDSYGEKLNYIGDFASQYSIPFLILASIISIVIIYLIATVICFIAYYIKYYEFTLVREGNEILIEYGMFNKRQFNFKVEQINSLKIKQNLMCQLLGLYTLEVSVIGYGNADGENIKSLLYPIVNSNMREEIVSNILGEFEFKSYINRAYKKYIHMFFIRRYICTILILGSICYIDTISNIGINIYVSLFILIMVIQTILGYMTYRNSGIGIDEEKILLSNGSVRKSITVIPIEKIQSIGYKQSIFQRNKNICNYVIDTYSENLSELIKIKNLDKKIISYIENKIV